MKAEINNTLAAIRGKIEKRLTPGASVHDASFLMLCEIRDLLLNESTPKTETKTKTPEPLPVQKTKKRWNFF